MSKYPPYSVLMSVYRKENPNWFRMSVDSMLRQTIPPDQVVIVADGELTTALDNVIDDFCQAYPELFTVVRLKENVGLAGALNYGLEHCRNSLVARMDSDDISILDRCEKELECFINNSELSIVGGNIDEFSENPANVVTSRKVPSDEEAIKKYARRRNPFNHPTVMFKKEAVYAMGGYNPMRRRAQDYELFAIMVHHGYHAMNLDETLVKFRANTQSVGRRKSWSHCMAHISVVNMLRVKKISSIVDLLTVFIGQLLIYMTPRWLSRIIIIKALRKETQN